MTELKTLEAELEGCDQTEEKLRLTLVFMREALSEGVAPRMRDFWAARKNCIPLFKEGVHPAIRSRLWDEFTELSDQARALKEHLDEASAFAVEQIKLAIDALGGEVDRLEEGAASAPPLALPLPCQTLEKRLPIYDEMQRKLALLNTWASRVNSLRKELISVSMRLRDKNQLFKQLSAVGEKVFPPRRELMTKISETFVEDVDGFIADRFVGGEPKGQLHALREEIKGLQAFAKAITVSTHVFATTRARLSECWDRVKASDRVRKKEIAEKRVREKERDQEREASRPQRPEPKAEPELDYHEERKEIEGEADPEKQVALCKERREAAKERIETLRKSAVSSGLDIGQALARDRAQHIERERLDWLEAKLAELKS